MNKITKKWVSIFLLAVSMVLVSNFLVNAQQNYAVINPTNNQCLLAPSLKLQVVDVKPESASDSKINMGDTIDVLFASSNGEKIDLESATNQGLITPDNLILYLNNYALNGLYGQLAGEDKFRFKLITTDKSQSAWDNILGGSLDFNPLDVNVSFGCPGGFPIKSNITKQIYLNTELSRLFLIIFTALLFLFLKFFRDSLRDDSQVPSFAYDSSLEIEIQADEQKRNQNKPPFSLSRTQMAWWFFIITSSFLFIFVRTGSFSHIINAQALTLIGISAGTGLSATIIDNGKNTLSSQEIKEIKQEVTTIKELQSDIKNLNKEQDKTSGSSTQTEDKTQKIDDKEETIKSKIKDIRSKLPCSSGFLQDLLANENGYSFHRYQTFLWTIVLGIIFLVEVVNNLQFPEFDTSLLTLLGISAGTYLGFKIPETPKSNNKNINS